MTATAYADIRRRLAEATGPDRELDVDVFLACGKDATIGGHIRDGMSEPPVEVTHGDMLSQVAASRPDWKRSAAIFFHVPEYTASLDAALALVEEMLPGWSWRVMNVSHGTADGLPKCSLKHPASSGPDVPGFGRTPVLAVLSALFAALESSP